MSEALALSPVWLDFAEAASRFLLMNWCVQATGWLAAGLLFSRLPRLRPSVRHAILLAGLLAATAAPATLAVTNLLRLPVRAISASPWTEWRRSVTPRDQSVVTSPLQRGTASGSAVASQPPADWSSDVGLTLTGLWLLLVVLRLGRLGVGYCLVARWGRGAAPVDRSLLFEACRYHVADIPVQETSSVQVPTVVGIIHPRILLPVGMAASLSPEGLGHVLLHEEAHVRRRDPLWLLIAELAHVLLVWHPLEELSRRSLAQAAEDACDARVLGHGAKETSYARTLLAVLEHSAPVPRLGFGCPLGSEGAELRRRVGQILQGSRPGSRFTAGLASSGLVMCGAAVTVFQLGERPVLPRIVSGPPAMVLQITTAAESWSPRPHPRLPVVLSGKPVDARRTLFSHALPGGEAAPVDEPELAELKVSHPREGRTLVFLLDNSSSMRPFQAEARADILAYLEQLAPSDRFNVIAFASDVSQFSTLPVAPSEEVLAGVKAWIGALPEAHGSNLGAGMLQALATPDLTSLVIYSDGKATGSVTDPNSLAELVARENPSHAHVLSVAFGAAPGEQFEFIPGVAPAPPAAPTIQAGEHPNDDLRP